VAKPVNGAAVRPCASPPVPSGGGGRRGYRHSVDERLRLEQGIAFRLDDSDRRSIV
jgi:hypothetical protein